MKRTLASIIAVLICSGAASPCYAQTDISDDISVVSIEQTEETAGSEAEMIDDDNEEIVGASASSGTCGANLKWSFDGSVTLTISGTGAMYSYTSDNIPWENAKQDIRTVVIGEGATTIGDNAFNGFYNISSLTLPSTLTKIGDSAFRGVGIGNGTTTPPLKTLSIPRNVSYIADNAFSGMSKLESVTVDSANTSFCSEDGALYNKSKTKLILLPAMKSGTYTIPAAVSSIGDYAFEGGNVSSIAVASGNNSFVVENDVLYNSSKTALLKYPAAKSITSFSVPSSVTDIKPYAFAGSQNLQILVLPSSVSRIGEYAFHSCKKLEKVNIPSSVTALEPYTFSYCESLGQVKIPGSVKTIKDCAFYSGNITALIIEEGVQTIGYKAFYSNTYMTSAVIPSSVTNVAERAFERCSRLAYLEIKASPDAFANKDKIFATCSKLKHIHIPADQDISSYSTNSNASFPKNTSYYVKTGSCSSSSCGLITEFPDDTPGIITQPSDASVYAGNAASFSVAVKGNVSSYQWQYSKDGVNGWTNSNASGAATSALTISPAATANNGYYRCVITFTDRTTLTTENAKLTIVCAFESQPKEVKINVGETATFSVTAKGSVQFYQWEVSTDNGSNWSSVSGATSNTLTINNAAAALNNNCYRCKVTFKGEDLFYSESAKLSVNAGSITSQPTPVYVTEGQNAVFTVGATGSVVSYQWLYSSDSGKSWNNVSASGANTNTLTLYNVNSGLDGYYYKCLVNFDGGQSEYSNSVMLTVKTAGEVTVSDVNNMSRDDLIKFVNTFVAGYEAEGQDTFVLTTAQLRAIERVLGFDNIV